MSGKTPVKPENFKKLQVRTGLSNAKLSQALSINQATLSKWRSSDSLIPIAILVRMEQLAQTKMEEALNDSE